MVITGLDPVIQSLDQPVKGWMPRSSRSMTWVGIGASWYELSRAIMDVLRAAEGPLSDAELVDRVMAVKSLDAENVDLRHTITERVKAVRKRLDM